MYSADQFSSLWFNLFEYRSKTIW